MTADILVLLSLPFVFYVLWGPVAFFFAAKAAIARFASGNREGHVFLRSALLLSAAFAPVIVTSEGGNMPVVFPWWLAALAEIANPQSVDFRISSFYPSLAVIPVIVVITGILTRRHFRARAQ